MYQSLYWKFGEIFGTSSFHLSNFVRILGSKIGYAHGNQCPKSWLGLCKASLADSSQHDKLESKFLIAWTMAHAWSSTQLHYPTHAILTLNFVKKKPFEKHTDLQSQTIYVYNSFSRKVYILEKTGASSIFNTWLTKICLEYDKITWSSFFYNFL